jgi:hypothetical protein
MPKKDIEITSEIEKKKYVDTGATGTVKSARKLDWAVVILAIVLDTACFAMLLWLLGWHVALAITLGLLIALVIDGSSYYFADVGLGNYLQIPKLRRIEDIKNDLNRAMNVVIFAGLIIVFGLGGFSLLRWEQIQREDVRLLEFEQHRQSEYFQSLPRTEQSDWERRHRPRYFSPNERTIDMIALIIPLLTSLITIAIGTSKRKDYNRYKDQIVYHEKSINDEEDEYDAEIKVINEKYVKDIENVQESYDKHRQNIIARKVEKEKEIQINTEMLRKEIEGDIGTILEILPDDDQEKDIYKIIKDRYDERIPYQNLLTLASKHSKKKAKSAYTNHVSILVTDLEGICGEILSIIKEWGDDQSLFATHTLYGAVLSYIEGNYDKNNPQDPIKQIGEMYLKLSEQKNEEGKLVFDDSSIKTLFDFLNITEGV